MLSIQSRTFGQLPTSRAIMCRSLCWDGSEMQLLFGRVLTDTLTERERQYKVALACYTLDVEGERAYMVAGWVSLTDWIVGDRCIRQLQGFVAPAHRGKGIATALCVCITHGLDQDQMPQAVFSEEFGAIARRLKWKCTQYKHVDDGWIATASFGLPEGGDSGEGFDAAGVHAAPPTVCGVPLASAEAGEAP